MMGRLKWEEEWGTSVELGMGLAYVGEQERIWKGNTDLINSTWQDSDSIDRGIETGISTFEWDNS